MADVEIKKPTSTIYKILIFLFLLPVIIYLLFAIGMISSNSSKATRLDWVKQYENILKNDFTYITDVKIYYLHGRVCFDYAASKQMSLDECIQITKMTKDFIVKESESHLLIKAP